MQTHLSCHVAVCGRAVYLTGHHGNQPWLHPQHGHQRQAAICACTGNGGADHGSGEEGAASQHTLEQCGGHAEVQGVWSHDS